MILYSMLTLLCYLADFIYWEASNLEPQRKPSTPERPQAKVRDPTVPKPRTLNPEAVNSKPETP